MKRSAILAYHHPESTLPLAKHLALQGGSVDYYFVVASGQSSAPAVEFGRTLYLPGLRTGNAHFMKETYRYFGGARVEVTLAVVPPYARRLFSAYSRAFFFKLGTLLKRKRYDFILVVGQDPFLLDVHRGLGPDEDVHHALHEVMPHYARQRVSHSLVDRLVESGKHIVVHSRAAHGMLVTRYGAGVRNASVIPFGVFETYLPFADRIEPTVTGRYFLFIGTLLPYKGLGVLLDAVKALGKGLRDFKVVVAGAGYDPAVEKMEALSQFVVIRRYLSNSEVATLTKNSTCVVCPYTSASQSGIVSTAFLFGRPIISSDVGAFPEFIESGRNGLLTPPGDALALAGAMRRVIDDDDCRQKMEAGAAAFASDPRYSWNALAHRYLSLASHAGETKVDTSAGGNCS